MCVNSEKACAHVVCEKGNVLKTVAKPVCLLYAKELMFVKSGKAYMPVVCEQCESLCACCV
jgi:hypothetical protein